MHINTLKVFQTYFSMENIKSFPVTQLLNNLFCQAYI